MQVLILYDHCVLRFAALQCIALEYYLTVGKSSVKRWASDTLFVLIPCVRVETIVGLSLLHVLNFPQVY